MMERHNRKSHLAPQLSPATKSLLRGDDKSSRTSSSRGPTPVSAVSGEIPISAIPATSNTRSRPAFPERTSSASQVPSNTMNLPIRPAPPPQPPLPRAPRRTEPSLSADPAATESRSPYSRMPDPPQPLRSGPRISHSNNGDDSRYYERS